MGKNTEGLDRGGLEIIAMGLFLKEIKSLDLCLGIRSGLSLLYVLLFSVGRGSPPFSCVPFSLCLISPFWATLFLLTS